GKTCDVASKDQVQALWDHAAKVLGSVDIWINNAGTANAQTQMHETPESVVHTLIDSNLKGTIFGSQVAITGFRAQGSGALYNMLGGSYNGKRLTPNMSIYSATKAGIWLITQYLLAENKGCNIMIGMISPGMLLSDNWFTEQKKMSPEEWQKMKPIMNTLCDHVETVAPWLADEVIRNNKYGHRIAWLTTGKILKRFISAKLPGRKRDLFSRYGLD
ncbi:MAG: SDR family oxidoreductase, partial [Gammaproteobacteria bacterium]|nr:SDR family oxidoreductase [Gammaproteobacteria bacterium]